MEMHNLPLSDTSHSYTFFDFDVASLNEVFVQIHSEEALPVEQRGYSDLPVERIELDEVLFFHPELQFPVHTSIILRENLLDISCSCSSLTQKLCPHQSRALYNICTRSELRFFFDEGLRRIRLKKIAEPFGLQHEENLDDYFRPELSAGKLSLKPSSPSLFATTRENTLKLEELFSPIKPAPKSGRRNEKHEMLLVFKQHKYYRHLEVELYEAPLTQSGKPKNPIISVDATDKIWKMDSPETAKFFSAIGLFQKRSSGDVTGPTIEALKAILKNPSAVTFFKHIPEVSENITSASVSPLKIGKTLHSLELNVDLQEPFYKLSARVNLNETITKLEDLTLKYDYFLEIGDVLYLTGNLSLLKLITLLKDHDNKLLIHRSKYEEFRERVLAKLEEKIEINYAYLPPLPEDRTDEIRTADPPQKLLYLLDSDPYIELNPVMRYGDAEIPVFSKKQIYPRGIKTGHRIKRDKEAEVEFIALLIKQHPYFEEQTEDGLPYFYLHKKHFLNEHWFLNAFEEWQNWGINILGFNKLKDNRLNPHKAKITVRVLSGVDWFNAEIDFRYGNKKASLKQALKAVKNKNKYIRLDDGTLGILPDEWMNKFADYFNSGEIADDSLKIPKTNFTIIRELFEEASLGEDVKTEIELLRSKLQNLDNIEEVEVPEGLNAVLREYQKDGLNRLNFLDDLNFGCCLADDMGLGKSLQILAFILLQRKKRSQNSNLLVVPASLIFSWQHEIQKFAPSIKTHVLHGSKRTIDPEQFSDFELIITTYGTLLSDIRFLKKFKFNYVFLDESQNIKNPDSQRYMAACLLKSRNRIVITGTPIENNTFDLFGQMSFACPGLLGTKQYFKEIYAIPIDQFKDRNRAAELQNKIAPFIIRRTKKQVATELPEKTEMVLYCEPGEEQQRIYNLYEREFRDFICSKTDEDLPKNTVHVLTGLTRLRQICNSPLLLNDDDINVKQSGKMDVLLEQVLSKSENHKILVFSQFVSMLDLIKKQLEEHKIDYSYLTGSTKNRQGAVTEFQTDKSKRVFLISLKAGGTGLNLTQADYVYLVDPWWNPAVENQAIDRIYRIGQKKNVVAVRLITSGTIEEKIMNLQETKKELFEDLINANATTGKLLNKEILLSLLQ